VFTVDALKFPAPVAIAKVIGTPTTAAPVASTTLMTNGFAAAVPAISICALPLTVDNTLVDDVTVVVNVTGATPATVAVTVAAPAVPPVVYVICAKPVALVVADYPGVGDRPDPRAPPPACRDGGPRRRRAESALDPRTVWTGRHATTRRGPPGPLSRTPTPRSRAGTFGVRVRPSGASDRSPGDRMPTGNAVRTAKETRRRAAGRPLRARRPSRGRRSRRTFAGYSTDPD